MMTRVALTGGIGAGKSLVAAELERNSVSVVDADLVAREVVAPGSAGLAEIVRRFGPGVIAPDGSLNRAALARLVFGDRQSKSDLEGIVHPLVAARSRELIDQHLRDRPAIPVVYVVPLLVESGRADEFHTVVLVDAPREIRVERLVQHRGMTREEAIARVDSQATDAQRRGAAHCVVDASQSLEQTRRAAHELAHELLRLWPDRLDQLPKKITGEAQLA